jgi:hypothetical protein
VTPRQSVEAECARRGRQSVVAGCCSLIKSEDADSTLIVALGGPHARRVLDGNPRAGQQYWLRVWGTRGLLWAWDDAALDAVIIALRDPAWRVRELAAKVVARHHLGDTLPAVLDLREDAVPRVRAAATRAIAILTQAGA